ncbi:MAG: hypothetical protein M0Z62_03185 [Actinomycetota bacterium]|nr:hypothetical protein [Actinomycetota bacterium]MDA8379331.1 hypothetical protein [Actinomycetota bacterium]
MAEISKAMGRVAGKVVPPDQMRAMMGEMMQTVFAGMTLDDRIAFVTAMLPQCLGAMFDNLEAPARERLAIAMAEQMASVARTAAEGSDR